MCAHTCTRAQGLQLRTKVAALFFKWKPRKTIFHHTVYHTASSMQHGKCVPIAVALLLWQHDQC